MKIVSWQDSFMRKYMYYSVNVWCGNTFTFPQEHNCVSAFTFVSHDQLTWILFTFPMTCIVHVNQHSWKLHYTCTVQYCMWWRFTVWCTWLSVTWLSVTWLSVTVPVVCVYVLSDVQLVYTCTNASCIAHNSTCLYGLFFSSFIRARSQWGLII